MKAEEFDKLVTAAYLRIAPRFRRRLANVALVVEPEPTPAHLTAGRVPRGGTLLGLYQGRPMTQRSVFDQFTLPDRITIFQGPHERMASSVEHLQRLVDETVWHEIAHYFGMDERQVRTAERKRRPSRRR